jgi:agmatine/peptidylarginine deiminase
MPKRENIVWFDDGMYQGGTDRGYDSVNLFDKDTDTIAVFRKDENGEYHRFTTTCTVTEIERKPLIRKWWQFCH